MGGRELAGLRVGDRVSVPRPGLRLRRTVLASGGGGALYVDTLKNHRARTVPLVLELVPIVDRWGAGKSPDAWLFDAPEGGPLRESNWKRSVGWSEATTAVGVPGFRVHDLRHTAASVWLAAGRGPEGGAAGARACNRGDDDGPIRPHDRCQLVASRPARRGHLTPPRGAFERIAAPGKVRKPLGAGLSWWSRLGESNPRPTHYEKHGKPLWTRYLHR
jgi:hypothetical protein